MALAAFCNFYSNENKNKIFYVLVNHNLRKNSFKEAKIVQKLFVKKKLKLTILNNKEIIFKDIQNRARIVRYDLLSSFCKKHNIKFILTGHHSDDQIETFLIRRFLDILKNKKNTKKTKKKSLFFFLNILNK